MDSVTTYGSKVFGRREMKKRLPVEVYESLDSTTSLWSRLDPAIAQTVADAMKDWAMEQGATHYTHWFQPMTGITAGKLDAFLSPDGAGGAIAEFSAKSLFVGEPDASSFPSGGLRATFEARGYTAWDPTSPAFVQGRTLYIPTAFCTYGGDALDAKTPLLRSMEAVSREAVRFCHSVGMTDVRRVQANCGAEQEYFIVDRKDYERRLDLKICGHTLLGAPVTKGQELSDHYFGRIRLRIKAFMEEVDRRLWELGVPAKTKHNEAAPAQHELAPVFESCNVACDHNQLTMEVLRTVAKEQGLALLLHEKPFAGVNGSGKHNNYSLSTDTGVNLLSPGESPEQNPIFLITLCAFIRAVDSYPELLRLAAAGPGNDCRLGGYEAPPPIISVFLGDALTQTLYRAAGEKIAAPATGSTLNLGVATSPEFTRDDSDRNRTSPFAFTGNKFEFRMVGSSQSIALANTVLNTILADSLNAFAVYFEDEGFTLEAIQAVIAETMTRHRRIIFNGNNYSDKWVAEARDRGLPILHDTVEAIHVLHNTENQKVLERFGVLSPTECQSRFEIMLENYNKTITLEATVLVEMVRRQVLPTVVDFLGRFSAAARDFTAAMGRSQEYLETHLARLSAVLDQIAEELDRLEQLLEEPPEDSVELADYQRDRVRPAMAALREACDRAEVLVDEKTWPMPTYTQLIYGV